MRSQIAILALALPVALTGCKVKTKTETTKYTIKPIKIELPPFQMDFDPDLFKDLFICNQETKELDREIENNALQVRGFTDKQDIESTDCEGKKTLSPKSALHNFKQNLVIEPPGGLEGKVASVSIKNTRTCAERQATVDPKSEFPLTQSALWEVAPYWASKDGAIVVGLNDSRLRKSLGLNALNGKNLLEITYRDADGKELDKKSVLVNATIEVRELNGIHPMNNCHDEKKRNKQ